MYVIKLTIPWMTKLRFLNEALTFNRKLYVTQLKGNKTIKVLRVILNIMTIYDNYHGDITMKRM